jgi:hypothetical protein
MDSGNGKAATTKPATDPAPACTRAQQRSSPDDSPAEDYRAHVVQDILNTEFAFLSEIELFLKAVASPVRALPHIPSKAKRALLGHLFRIVHVCWARHVIFNMMGDVDILALFFGIWKNSQRRIRLGGSSTL